LDRGQHDSHLGKGRELMAAFNPAEYETVAERLKRALADHHDLRIVTHNQTQQHDRAISTWIVYTEIFLNAEDQRNNLAKATGLAFEVDGVGMANKTSALENAETSSLGRALSHMGYFGDKKATREEMAKVERGQTPPAPNRDWLKEAEDLAWKEDIDGLRRLFVEADRLKASQEVLNKIKELGNGHKGSKDSAK